MTQKSGIQPKLLCPDKLAYVCVKPLLESGQKNIYVVTSTNDGTHKVVEQGVGTDATVQLSLSGFNKSPRITLVDVSIAIPEIVRVSAGGTVRHPQECGLADGKESPATFSEPWPNRSRRWDSIDQRLRWSFYLDNIGLSKQHDIREYTSVVYRIIHLHLSQQRNHFNSDFLKYILRDLDLQHNLGHCHRIPFVNVEQQ
ncbi:hypothetical protein AAVH_00117 [Aphelenchoides avenae]|nr:hypothetical protein AAVH_00117 [Aphelenchus avenae]